MTLRTRSSHPEGLCKKGTFKNFTEKHLCRGLFLIRIQARALSLYYKETPVLVFFFLNSGKFLKTVNCYCNIFCDSLFVKFQVFTV